LASLAGNATVTGGSGADTLAAINTNVNTIDMGAGNDSVVLASVVASNTGTIAGGDGTDSLTLADASATLITSGNKATFSSFEKMISAANGDILNFEALTTFTELQLNGGTSVVVNNLSSSAAESVLVAGNQTTAITLNIKGGTTVGSQDTLGLTLDNTTANTATTIAALTSDGTETINIVSSGAGTNTNSVDIAAATNNVVNINISGESNLTLTDAADVAGQQIITSTGTGAITVTFDADTEGTAVTTGSGNDNVLTNTGADNINVGGGNNTANSDLGIDTVTFGTGNNTYQVNYTTAEALPANRATITGFDAATDSLKLDGTAFVNIGRGDDDDITSGAAANQFATITTAGAVAAQAATVGIIELSFEFSSGVDLDSNAAGSLNGTNLLSALGAATGTTAGTITTNGNDEDTVLIAYQDGDALIYHGNGAGGNTALVAAEINLIAILQGVGVGDLTNADFIA
jgi:hypothetical protein